MRTRTAVAIVIACILGAVLFARVGEAYQLAGVTLNGWLTYIGAVGVGMSLWGLYLAYVQIRLTRAQSEHAATAAEAARTAVEATRREIAERMSLGEYGIGAELCLRAIELLDAENFVATEQLVFRLRRCVVEANRLVPHDDAELAVKMQDAVAEVRAIQESVFRLTRGQAASRSDVVRRLKALHAGLTGAYENERLRALVEG